MRFLFAKRDTSAPPPRAGHNVETSSRKPHGARNTNFETEGREIESVFAAAIRRLTVKRTADLSGTTAPTVEAWRLERNAPRFIYAMFLARRVSSIRNAVMEIIGGNDPHKNKLLNVLFTRLSEISVGPDEVSAARARAALVEFEAARRSVDDGDAP